MHSACGVKWSFALAGGHTRTLRFFNLETCGRDKCSSFERNRGGDILKCARTLARLVPASRPYSNIILGFLEILPIVPGGDQLNLIRNEERANVQSPRKIIEQDEQ